MPSLTHTSSLHKNIYSVKPPDLPSNYAELVKWRYRHHEGEVAVSKLAQGELDVLELARQALGWPSILSLAVKWYPLYPNRTCWRRALERCHLERIQSSRRTVTLNLKYLLLTVITKVHESLSASYGYNRLLHSSNTNTTKGSNRLTQLPKHLWCSRGLNYLVGRLTFYKRCQNNASCPYF